MDWINSLLFEPSAMQTVVVLSLVCAIGLAAGKIRVMGISLGVAFVFFIGILEGHVRIASASADIRIHLEIGLSRFIPGEILAHAAVLDDIEDIVFRKVYFDRRIDRQHHRF